MTEKQLEKYLEELEQFGRELPKLETFSSGMIEVFALSLAFMRYGEEALFGETSKRAGFKLWIDRKHVRKYLDLLDRFPLLSAQLDERLEECKEFATKEGREKLSSFLEELNRNESDSSPVD